MQAVFVKYNSVFSVSNRVKLGLSIGVFSVNF